MKKTVAVLISLLLVFAASFAFADTISVGDTKIQYDSFEELQEVFATIKERMASEYKIALFDADTYDSATYIVGETFPAGRYYVYPVTVSETNTDLYAKLLWWDKDKLDSYSCTGYVCAQWCNSIELSDGMRIEFSWDEDQRGVCIALQKLPDKPTNLMEIFN